MSRKDSIDRILEDSGALQAEETSAERLLPITLWIKEDYKHKFDNVQKKTKNKFGKALKKVVYQTLDKIPNECA